MRKWRIEGWVSGELTGEIRPLESGDIEEHALETGDLATGELAGGQFDEPPRWREFWPDEPDAVRPTDEPHDLYYDDTAAHDVLGAYDEPAYDPRPPALRDPLNRRLWAWAFAIALAGVAARAIWYVRFKDDLFFRLGPDGDTYLAQAQAFLEGAIADPASSILASAYREVFPPGYPLFIAGILKPLPDRAVFAQYEYVLATVRVIQWLLAGATTLMTFALARRVLFGYTALIPPALLTASIAMVDLPNLFAYETLLAFLLTASLLLLVRAKENPASHDARLSIALAGVLFGYGALVQPRILVALPLVIGWSAKALGRRTAVLLTIAALLAPGAWIARNYGAFGQFVPISINGQASLYLDNVDPVGGAGFTKGAAPPQCPRSELMDADIERRFEWARCMQTAGIEELAEHPAETARAIPDRMAALISPWNEAHARGTYFTPSWNYQRLVPDETRRGASFKAADDTLLVVWLTFYALIIVIGAVTLWVEGPGSTGRLIAIPLIALPLVHLLFHAENRFRVPLLPIILIASTLGLLNLLELMRDRRHSNAGR